MGRHSGDGGDRRVLVVTADEDLLDALLRLGADAGVELDVAPDAGSANSMWGAASLILLDASLIDDVETTAPARRSGVIVVGRDLDDASIWRRAVRVGADSVVFLPDCVPWLVEQLTAAVRTTSSSQVVAILGSVGGAGVSTLAASLAMRALDRHVESVLVDADPLGGGLDLLLGVERLAGVRWHDLAQTSGRMEPTALIDVLPRSDGLAVLSWSQRDGSAPSDEAFGHVLNSLIAGSDLVVCDLALTDSGLTHCVLEAATTAIVVVPARVRAVAAAASLRPKLHEHIDDVRLVVRAPAPGGLDANEIAGTLQWPLLETLSNDGRRAEWEENGLPPSIKGQWRRVCDRVLDSVVGLDRAA